MTNRTVLCATLVLTAATALAWGQSGLSFEVASVKAAPPVTDGKVMVSMSADPGRINYAGLPLRTLIARAYRLKDYQISGLDDFRADRYDVVAKLPAGAARDQIPEMLQTLLAERFKLAVHREQKEMPVYALVVGKGGIKMKEVEPATGNQRQSMGMGQLDLPKAKLSMLADVLSRMLDRPVLDMSGSTATYDIALQFTPDENTMGGMKMAVREGGPEPHGDRPNTDGAPGIFTAIQEQLGLKLESRKAPVEILVIDHAEKIPTEN